MSRDRAEVLNEGSMLAFTQKEELKKRGGYAMIPHEIGRKLLPQLVEEYGGRTARDALALFFYLHAHANGEQDRNLYLWAFPPAEKICVDTGIDKNRLSKLGEILIKHKLIWKLRIPWNGHTKAVYLPLYFTGEEIE
jgi:hypothetical protein